MLVWAARITLAADYVVASSLPASDSVYSAIQLLGYSATRLLG